MDRVVTVYSNVLNDYNPTEINDKIREITEKFEIPKNIKVNFTGEQEEQAKEMAFLSKALLIAVLLIFLILVAQFNSATTPIIISISVFLSLIGVLFGLLIFRMDFVVLMTMIGIISLAGIVVNNAIVLIDYINLTIVRKRRELGLPVDSKLTPDLLVACVVEGGKTRLRPVILTAITTILGLLPLVLASGPGSELQKPLAVVVIGGTISSTLLTLILLPTFYAWIENKITRKNKSGVLL